MVRLIVEIVLKLESLGDPNESYSEIVSCCTVCHAELGGSVAIQMKVVVQKPNLIRFGLFYPDNMQNEVCYCFSCFPLLEVKDLNFQIPPY